MSELKIKPEKTTQVMRVVIAVLFILVLALSGLSFISGAGSNSSSEVEYSEFEDGQSESPF